MKKERGITLVALIITIIILVILSAITIQNTIGEHGLIEMATQSAVRSKIAEYKEGLDQIGIVIMTENAPKNLTGREYLEEFKKKVDESELFKDKRSAEIIGAEEGETEEKLRVVTKEGFVYDVTEKEIKYVGRVGEEGFTPLPDLKDPKIEIIPSEKNWVNHPITAKITVSEELESFIIQYTTRTETSTEALSGWKKYDLGSNIDIETNETIFVRVIDSVGNATSTASKRIENIDRIVPDQPTDVKVTDTKTNSITVTAKAKDGVGTDTTHYQEESGVEKIIFALKEEGEPQEKTVTATGTAEVTAECTFEQLKQNKDYTITVKAVDKAGNESAITEITQKTGTVPGGESLKDGNITFAYDKDEWTRGPVNVTITSTYTGQGYTLQYTTKLPTENDWKDYGSGPVKMTTNGTIYARLKDSTNQTGAASSASGRVSNIDTIVPNDLTEGKVTNKTTNSITVTAKAKDGDPTADKPGEQSGIAKIKFEITGLIGGTTKTVSQEKTVTITKPSDTAEAECIFTGLTQTQSYTITAKAVDKAGNVSTNAISITGGSTGTVPGGNDLKDGNIAFAYDKDGWTKGPVNVTITSTYTGQGYTLQYTTKAPVENDWKDYGSGPVKMTTNGTIYARLKDSTGQLGTASTATGTVSNIDTISPKNPTSVTAVAVEGTDGKKNCIKVEATAQDGDVTTAKPGEQSGIAKMQVKIDSGSWTDVTATSEKGATVTASYTSASQTGGAHTIQVKAIDKAGNESGEVSANSVTIDATPPTAPTIEVISGTLKAGTTDTYTSAITVRITPGTDAEGVKDTTYSVTETNESGTLTGTNTKEITFRDNGEYTISATTTDTSGNTASATKKVTKAGTPPTIVASADRSYEDGTHKITITATGSDAEGGTLTYTVSYGKTATYGNTKTATGTAGQPVTITIDSDLEMATTYYYKVDVKDTDDTSATNPITDTIKTYCVAKSCDGGHTESHSCTACGGRGYTSVTCSGEYRITYTAETVSAFTVPYFCVGCYQYWTDGESARRATGYCSVCGGTRNFGLYHTSCGPSWDEVTHTRNITCTASGCKNGTVYESVPCEHKQNSAHLYCPTTGEVVTSELHDD